MISAKKFIISLAKPGKNNSMYIFLYIYIYTCMIIVSTYAYKTYIIDSNMRGLYIRTAWFGVRMDSVLIFGDAILSGCRRRMRNIG